MSNTPLLQNCWSTSRYICQAASNHNKLANEQINKCTTVRLSVPIKALSDRSRRDPPPQQGSSIYMALPATQLTQNRSLQQQERRSFFAVLSGAKGGYWLIPPSNRTRVQEQPVTFTNASSTKQKKNDTTTSLIRQQRGQRACPKSIYTVAVHYYKGIEHAHKHMHTAASC